MSRRSPFELVTIGPEQVMSPESLGSKDKFWLQSRRDPAEFWLFKHSQPNTGQHWAEKVAAEIAAVLDIPHAEVELAVFQGQPGAISKNFVLPGQELFHGNQALARVAADQNPYDPEKRFKQSNHTLGNILTALAASLPESEIINARNQFATYLILDALIGNTDRHHENWGILSERTSAVLPGSQPRNWQNRLAPTYDHASSLGRELIDEGPSPKSRLNRLRQKGGVEGYAERARGAIFHKPGDPMGLSPLELVRLSCRNWPEHFRPGLLAVASLDWATFEDIVDAVPAEMMTTLAKDFALAMLRYSLNELRRLNP